MFRPTSAAETAPLVSVTALGVPVLIVTVSVCAHAGPMPMIATLSRVSDPLMLWLMTSPVAAAKVPDVAQVTSLSATSEFVDADVEYRSRAEFSERQPW